MYGEHVTIVRTVNVSCIKNNTSSDTIALENYDNPPIPSENITNSIINSTKYLEIANRVKSFMDSNKRAPNYATQTSTGNTIRFESLVYMYSQILNSYNQTGVLPDNVNVTSWYYVTNKINSTNLIGNTSYGYVEKENIWKSKLESDNSFDSWSTPSRKWNTHCHCQCLRKPDIIFYKEVCYL